MEIKCQLDATDDFYCRLYCLLNMFRAPLCPSSGAREYYTDGRCLWYLVLWFSCCRYGVELRFMCPVCRLQAAPDDGHNGAPETCLASNKICNKYHLLHLVGILFPLIMCICSLRYPTCNAHEPYRHLLPALLYNIFPHYLISGTIFEKKNSYWTQHVCLDFLYSFCLKHFSF